MWVKRTPAETIQSFDNSKSEALAHGFIVGGMAWVLGTVILAGGWLINFSLGLAVQYGEGGAFWSRVPRSALVALLFAGFVFWYERRKVWRKEIARTVCLQCEAVGESNAGAACACGGEFVSRNSVKWVEKPKNKNG